MAIALILPDKDMYALQRAILRRDKQLDVQIWPDVDQHAARLAVVWQQPPGALARIADIDAVLSFGAGVDGLLHDHDLPQQALLGRIVYPELCGQIAQYCLGIVLARHRHLWTYTQDQANLRWRPRSVDERASVGILGLGEAGRACATVFQQQGFRVLGWSRRQKMLEGVVSLTGDNGLVDLTREADYLICLLPLTEPLRGILNADLFVECKQGAYLINAARGAHLIERDLLEALDAGRLAGACLDVFDNEPLPKDHPFWAHPQIRITPHIAGVTNIESAAQQIVEDYRRVCRGESLAHPVDRGRGY